MGTYTAGGRLGLRGRQLFVSGGRKEQDTYRSKNGSNRDDAARERDGRKEKRPGGGEVKELSDPRGKKRERDEGDEKALGVYIPPFKLVHMMKDVADESSPEYQRMTWDALRKSINGLVNKANASNIKDTIPEMFTENLERGRGLFARSCIKSQMAYPAFSHVLAARTAVVNTKCPELGELVVKRIILQLKKSFGRNDKPRLLAAANFIAHLVNQQVAHKIIALELQEVPTLLDS